MLLALLQTEVTIAPLYLIVVTGVLIKSGAISTVIELVQPVAISCAVIVC